MAAQTHGQPPNFLFQPTRPGWWDEKTPAGQGRAGQAWSQTPKGTTASPGDPSMWHSFSSGPVCKSLWKLPLEWLFVYIDLAFVGEEAAQGLRDLSWYWGGCRQRVEEHGGRSKSKKQTRVTGSEAQCCVSIGEGKRDRVEGVFSSVHVHIHQVNPTSHRCKMDDNFLVEKSFMSHEGILLPELSALRNILSVLFLLMPHPIWCGSLYLPLKQGLHLKSECISIHTTLFNLNFHFKHKPSKAVIAASLNVLGLNLWPWLWPLHYLLVRVGWGSPRFVSQCTCWDCCYFNLPSCTCYTKIPLTLFPSLTVLCCFIINSE